MRSNILYLVADAGTQSFYFLRRTDPDMLLETRIADHLAPADTDLFIEATRQLQEDDSHTLEVNSTSRSDQQV